MVQDILGFIEDRLNDVASFVVDVADNIRGVFNSALTTAQDTADGVIASALTAADSIIARSRGIADSVQNTVSSNAFAVLNSIGATLDRFGTKVDASARTLLGIPDSLTDLIESRVLRPFTEQLSEVASFVDGLEGKITSGINAQVETIQDIVLPVISKVEEVRNKIFQGIEASIGAMGDAFGNAVGGLGDAINKQIQGWWGYSYGESFGIAAEQVDGIIQALENDPHMGAIFRQISPTGIPVVGLLGSLFIGGAVGTIISAATGVKFAGPLELMRQDSFESSRPLLPTPIDLLQIANRVPAARSQVLDLFRRHGFSEELIPLMETLRFQLFNVGELFALQHRGEMTPETVDKRLEELGFDGIDKGFLETLSHPLPAIQDMILFAVREVYSPEIAAEFGQFEEIPPDYLIDTARQGLTEERAKQYWAAHWVLPSIQQGFEMLHRRVIDEEKMGKLLLALDIMPGWRQQLEDISFRPLTRVDVRRMHKTGVLGPQEVLEAYKDFGYSKLNAQRMTDFTIAFNTPPNKEDADELKKLTRAQVLTFLEEGLFEPEEATQALQDIDYSKEIASSFVALKQLDMSRERRDVQIRIIRAQFANEAIDFNGAIGKLSELDLAASHLSLVSSQLEAERQSQSKNPSLAHLTKFRKNNLVTDEEFIAQVTGQGYSRFWADKYLALVAAGEEAG